MITDLRLQNFRSYSDESFDFQTGVNIIVGPNASGKTNLLEAILVLATGASYRAKDSELIRFNQPWARLDAHESEGHDRTLKLLTEPKLTKQYELAGKNYFRLSLAQRLPVVLFEPNHLQLLSGSPDGRRGYLDDLLEQTRPGYATLRRAYRRTLAQRNALLKRPGGTQHSQFFPWNIRLSELAGQIVRERTALVETIDLRLSGLYKALARNNTVAALRYQAHWPPEHYETPLLKKLEANIELDTLRGFTGSGPHREDVGVYLDGRPAGETASRGEARTFVLALKIIELQILEEARGIAPLLLLDDVFSELDGARRRALTEHLSNYQTFITTTDADIVLHNFASNCNVIAL